MGYNGPPGLVGGGQMAWTYILQVAHIEYQAWASWLGRVCADHNGHIKRRVG